MSKLKQYVQQIINGQGMLFHGIIILIAVLAVIGGGIKLTVAYREAAAVKAEIENMNQYIISYNNLAKEINTSPFNAVAAEQLDQVQSQIILQVQHHNLQLLKLNILSKNDAKKDIHGKVYEITTLGSWSDTFHFIDQLGSKDALISERYVSMKPDKNGMIEMVMEYKVYTK